MNQDEKNQISAGLSEIIERFRSLKDQPINPPPPWPVIQRWIGEAHKFFVTVLEAFIQPCGAYLAAIEEDTRDFEQWQFNLADLWQRMDFLRGIHNRAFCHNYTAIIYHHIFIEELFECLPEQLKGARPKFLLLPSGDLVVWPMNEAFYELAPTWFSEAALGVFDKLRAADTIVCFECHRDRNFERQAVLAHEIIHIIIRNNKGLEDSLTAISGEGAFQKSLNASGSEIRNQIEELFCDYTAAWFYGPVYLQAFADELSHYPVSSSDTHPASDLRAKLLLDCHEDFKGHRAYKSLLQYFQLRKLHNLPTRAIFRKIAKRFESTLLELGLKKYSHIEQEEEIARSFEHNIPTVAKDIRTFINNLPQRKPTEDLKRYNELVSESLRKTNLLRQITSYMREPDALFAMPAALSPKSSRGK
jgi:hypothetical protein